MQSTAAESGTQRKKKMQGPFAFPAADIKQNSSAEFVVGFSLALEVLEEKREVEEIIALL